MKTTQLFNPKICLKNKCLKLRYDNCFGIPERCEINQKAGYPKEVKL